MRTFWIVMAYVVMFVLLWAWSGFWMVGFWPIIITILVKRGDARRRRGISVSTYYDPELDEFFYDRRRNR